MKVENLVHFSMSKNDGSTISLSLCPLPFLSSVRVVTVVNDVCSTVAVLFFFGFFRNFVDFLILEALNCFQLFTCVASC